MCYFVCMCVCVCAIITENRRIETRFPLQQYKSND